VRMSFRNSRVLVSRMLVPPLVIAGGALLVNACIPTWRPRLEPRRAPLTPLYRAAVDLKDPSGATPVSGHAIFTQRLGQPVHIKAVVHGLPDGPHGFHIHESGDLSKGCTSAGGHFNPYGNQHGGPDDEDRHVGDLGNIVSKGGIATYERLDKVISLSGPLSIVNRSAIVHAGEDDLGRGKHDDSKTTGHSGARVACGVVRRV